MALSPIKMFQSDQSSLAQILAGGNQTISGIMDRAIQIGRDISNKQLAQERDLLAMRQQETALSQRRAENLQQNIEDAQRFARSAFEADRQYGLQEQSALRADTQQLFSQGMAKRGMAVQEAGLGIREKEAAAREAERQREDEFSRQLATGGEAQELPPEKKTTMQRFGDVATAVASDIKDLFTGGGSQKPAPVAEPALDAGKLRGEIDISTARLKALEGRDAKAYQAELRRRGELEAQLKQAETTQRPRTQASIDASNRSEERLRMSKEAAASKAAEEQAKVLVGDTGAFVRPTQWMAQKYKTDASGNLQGVPPEQLVEAKSYEKDPFTAEVNYALNQPDVEKYVNPSNMTLTQAQKDKRRKLWEYAHKQGGSSSPAGGGAVSQIPGI